ncbi:MULTISPECIES: hypothetical protein [unclassified Streptomyces]|uniref:hypothetical protein n=1 Tax=unclassified Streptomyces TaxID=2593676 RepID=UPI0033BCCF89
MNAGTAIAPTTRDELRLLAGCLRDRPARAALVELLLDLVPAALLDPAVLVLDESPRACPA